MMTLRDGDYYCTYFLWFENELVCGRGEWTDLVGKLVVSTV